MEQQKVYKLHLILVYTPKMVLKSIMLAVFQTFHFLV